MKVAAISHRAKVVAAARLAIGMITGVRTWAGGTSLEDPPVTSPNAASGSWTRSAMRWMRVLVVVATLVAVGTAFSGSAHAKSAAPDSAAPYVSSTIPKTKAGAQLRWFLAAVESLPLADSTARQHFSAAFLAELPEEALNEVLAQAGNLQEVRFLGLVAQTPTSLDAAVDLGPDSSRLVVALTVDSSGLIATLNFKAVPLRTRDSLGLLPVALPDPSGASPVGTTTLVVSDQAHHARKIPVQLWYPAAARGQKPQSKYAQAKTSAALSTELAVPLQDVQRIATHASIAPAIFKRTGRLPIVLFSPGQGITRPLNTSLAAEIASHGYVVAVLDHPGDGQLVEFPDGTAIQATSQSDDADLEMRVADARSVLDQLATLNNATSGLLRHALDLNQVAIVGHSFGGATAAEAMRLDPRFQAGINLDGTLYGDVVDTGVNRPFLLISSDRPEDDTWTKFRAASPSATSLVIDGTGHMSFTDWETLITSFRSGDEFRNFFAPIGRIDPHREFEIESAYVLAFLNHTLRGADEALLDEASPPYPEAHFR